MVKFLGSSHRIISAEHGVAGSREVDQFTLHNKGNKYRVLEYYILFMQEFIFNILQFKLSMELPIFNQLFISTIFIKREL